MPKPRQTACRLEYELLVIIGIDTCGLKEKNLYIRNILNTNILNTQN